MNRYAVVLAAGKGTRMKSKLHKVLHSVCGKPMVQHVVDQVKQVNVGRIVAVIGQGAEKVRQQLGADDIEYALQKEQLGTAHAVIQAESMLASQTGTTVVLSGDTPLITSETIDALLQHHESTGAKVTILTSKASNPTGYGRIIRDAEGNVNRIVEEKDASAAEKKVTEINTSIYCFDNKTLFETLPLVDNHNVQGEYYLPDVIEILQNKQQQVSAYVTEAFDETVGINDRVALAEAERLLRKRINQRHLKNGVTIVDPERTYISQNTVIGQDTTIYPGSVMTGETTIGADCTIGPNSEVKDSQVGDHTVIRQSVVHDSSVGKEVNIGPFAHIRPQSEISDSVKVGNFVEVKKSSVGKGSKLPHLSYIGDAEIGQEVNIGCGSITVNYDGNHKYVTKVKDRAFIGCNVNLMAPVTVGEDSIVAAGSTITDDVPNKALSIARSRQTNKENYAEKLKRKGT